MRLARVILVTIFLSLGASWFLWRDRLTSTRLTKPPTPPPTTLQRQFGPRIGPELAGALERKLPATFDTTGGFDATIARLRAASGVHIFVNWRSVEARGAVSERTPVNVAVGGMPMSEALTKILASLPSSEPLGAHAGDDALMIDVASQLEWATITRVYDVRDLVTPPGNATTRATAAARAGGGANPIAAAIVAQIEQTIAPGTWRPQGGVRDGPRRRGSIRHLSGQLIVTQTPDTQYDVVQYLNALRVSRARWDFAGRAGTLTGACVGVVTLLAMIRHLLRRRAARRAGLCRRCGYDLRASEGRCPECGTTFAPVAMA